MDPEISKMQHRAGPRKKGVENRTDPTDPTDPADPTDRIPHGPNQSQIP
jgi:hypothetical protein